MICWVFFNMSFHTVSMQERSSSVECEASLGELILVKLRTEPFMGLDNEWFCNKITVRTPEGEEILFPCYCWLRSNDSIALQPAKGMCKHFRPWLHLPCSDINSTDHEWKTAMITMFASLTPSPLTVENGHSSPVNSRFSSSPSIHNVLPYFGWILWALRLLSWLWKSSLWIYFEILSGFLSTLKCTLKNLTEQMVHYHAKGP